MTAQLGRRSDHNHLLYSPISRHCVTLRPCHLRWDACLTWYLILPPVASEREKDQPNIRLMKEGHPRTSEFLYARDSPVS